MTSQFPSLKDIVVSGISIAGMRAVAELGVDFEWDKIWKARKRDLTEEEIDSYCSTKSIISITDRPLGSSEGWQETPADRA